ncbi:MAG: asparagine synthase-related protein [Candidatus Methanomethylicaceae archaeon]
MCGFLGRILRDPGAVRKPITAADSLLKRRGPDMTGLWTSPDRRIEIVFYRLSIVDHSERASQPICREDLGLVVAMNGEVYNYEEIRGRLWDQRFTSGSDAEVLLVFFRKRGLEGLQEVRGSFAACIVDEWNSRLYLIQDPVGKRPLAVYPGSTEVIFGSSTIPLAVTASSQPKFDDQAINDFWKQGYINPTRTIFDGIQNILPGEVWEFDFSGNLLQRIKQRPPTRLVSVRTFEEAVEVSRTLIRQATERRLSNNPRPICLLSGGIDSTIVAKSLSEIGSGECITVAGSRLWVPDYSYAKYACKRLRLPLIPIKVRLASLAEEVAWALDLQDEPFAPISFFPLALMMREVKKHSKVVLTGDGGDEVFLGYGRAEQWVDRSVSAASEAAEPLVGPLVPQWMSRWGRQWIGVSLLGHMFRKLDRASAEQGVEARCPLLDWDLIAAARTFPPELLLRNGKTKAILKAILSDFGPQFTDRKKVGFTFRIRWLWLRSLYSGLRELIEPEAIDCFAHLLPRELRYPARRWSTVHIFRNFDTVWRLLVWSQFLRRLREASRKASQAESLGIVHK